MATGRTKRTRKTRAKFRASWRGQLRFGLVSFEVQAVNAANKEHAEVHFHLLHEPDHERIHYAKICPKHGEVNNEEIVEGYEYAKGRYIEFAKEELDTLRSDQEKALTIDAFVPPEAVDPIYFDGRMYYLMPSKPDDSEPYALLEAAMSKNNRWAVGQVVFSGREQLAIVRPMNGLLVMAMLNYAAEIREPEEVKAEFTRARTTPRKQRLAEDLVTKWQDKHFDLTAYKDRYRQKVQHAIEAKEKGLPLEPPEEEEPEVINLMDALQQSVARMTAERKTSTRKGHPRKSSATSRRRRA